MQIENSNQAQEIQNISGIYFANSVKSQNPQQSTKSGDTVRISDEAKALYEKMLQEQENSGNSVFSAGFGTVQTSSQSSEEASGAVQEFKKVLDKHRSGGGGSSGSSTESIIEQLESEIKTVSSELTSIAGAMTTNANQENNARVQQLETKLTQLKTQLAQVKSEASSE